MFDVRNTSGISIPSIPGLGVVVPLPVASKEVLPGLRGSHSVREVVHV